MNINKFWHHETDVASLHEAFSPTLWLDGVFLLIKFIVLSWDSGDVPFMSKKKEEKKLKLQLMNIKIGWTFSDIKENIKWSM